MNLKTYAPPVEICYLRRVTLCVIYDAEFRSFFIVARKTLHASLLKPQSSLQTLLQQGRSYRRDYPLLATRFLDRRRANESLPDGSPSDSTPPLQRLRKRRCRTPRSLQSRAPTRACSVLSD